MANKVQTNAKSAAKAKAAKRAPDNAKALQQKAADNVKRLNDAKGKVKPDTIISNVHSADGSYIVVTNAAGDAFTYPRNQDRADLRKAGAKGSSYSAFLKHLKEHPLVKPQAKLAKGVEGKMTENSRKAVEDQKVAPKAAKSAAPKAGKNKQPARGADRGYTKGSTAITANPDSWRHHMLTVICKHTNTAKAKAAHEKSGKFSGNKLDFNWAAAQGYINWAK